MRITTAESPFLGSLLPPAEKIKSWALDVEEEESRERVTGNKGHKINTQASPKWLDHGSREARNTRRDRETLNQLRSVSKHNTSQDYSHRSLRCQDRANPANHRDAEIRKSDKACHALFNEQDRSTRRAGEARQESRKQSKREERDCIRQSEQRSRHRTAARHVHLKITQSSTSGDRSKPTRSEYNCRQTQPGPLKLAVADDGLYCPRGHEVEKSPRQYSERLPNLCNDDAESPGSDNIKVEGRTGSVKQNEQWSCNGFVKEESKGLLGKNNLEKEETEGIHKNTLDTVINKSERPKQRRIEEGFGSAGRSEVGTLQLRQEHEGYDIATSRVEDKNSIIAEEPSLQSSSCSSMSMMGVYVDADAGADADAGFNAKKEYEMLASLLLDDSLDIDQDFDVTLAASGLGSSDPVFCGSIFGDDLELPTISMDMEPAVEVRSASSPRPDTVQSALQPAHIENSHGCAVFGRFEDGKRILMQNSVSIVEKMALSHLFLEDNGSKSQGGFGRLAEASPLSRVLIDVTNTFEMQDDPDVKGKAEEDDAHRISQRQRQIEFGKNTLGYERYSELVPRCKRKLRDPQTPNPKQVCSKRSWDGQVRKWRRLLHAYDPPHEEGEEQAEDFGTHISHMKEDTVCKRDDQSQGVSEFNDRTRRDANLTIYEDWNEF